MHATKPRPSNSDVASADPLPTPGELLPNSWDRTTNLRVLHQVLQSLGTWRVHDDSDASQTDRGTDQIPIVGSVPVEKDTPGQGTCHENATIGGQNASKVWIWLQRDDKLVSAVTLAVVRARPSVRRHVRGHRDAPGDDESDKVNIRDAESSMGMDASCSTTSLS